jgi:peptidoglycan/LPS O-acetylase OafA/YrhL
LAEYRRFVNLAANAIFVRKSTHMSASLVAYRGDLQGVRAIAVLAVLLFHVWPSVFRGGFVGVDVFFVISGFLITSLLVAEIDLKGKIDLLQFWARRMMRLLPAATVVLLAALAGALIYLPRTEFVNSAKHVLAAALYVENWALVAQSVDYWATGQAPSPVQHYWSLSIEEQFYFVWPPIVALTAFFSTLGWFSFRKAAAWLLVGVLTVSLALSILPGLDAGDSYFKTTTRAWELALGALIAVVWPKINFAKWVRSVLGWLGFVLVALAILFINEQMRFPGWVALVPTLGAALLLVAGDAPWSPYRLLAAKPVAYVGDISYALYLWHWTIVIFARPLGEDAGKAANPVLIIGLTFALAIATKYFIEDPFRYGRFGFHLRSSTRARGILKAFGAALAMIGVTAGLAAALEVRQLRINEELLQQNFASSIKDPNYPGAAALDVRWPAKVPPGMPLRPNPQIAETDMRYRYRDCMNMGKVCEFGNPQGKTTVVLAGDSHAMHYAPALETIAKKQNWKLLVMVKVACPLGDFGLYSEGKYRGDCDLWRGKMVKWMQDARPDFIVTSGGLQGVYGGLPPLEKQIEGYRRLWQTLKGDKGRLIVIRDNPLIKLNPGKWLEVPPCLSWHPKNPERCNKPRELTLDSMKDAMLLAAKDQPRTGTIDLTPWLCTKEICPAVIGNIVVYRDAHHLTETYMNTLAPYIEAELVRVMAALR